ncbi:hypothetical protein PG984_013109 [Apiospora sp. TS-2023a]
MIFTNKFLACVAVLGSIPSSVVLATPAPTPDAGLDLRQMPFPNPIVDEELQPVNANGSSIHFQVFSSSAGAILKQRRSPSPRMRTPPPLLLPWPLRTSVLFVPSSSKPSAWRPTRRP